MKTLFAKPGVLLLLGVLTCTATYGQGVSAKTTDESFIMENYYKVRWGYAEEFILLWKKNHYPLLKKAVEKGDLLKVTAEKPRYHSTEEGRWDFKVILVFKNVQAAFDPNLTETYKKQLYPDADKLVKDEQHRFELLIAHWDVPVQAVELEK